MPDLRLDHDVFYTIMTFSMGRYYVELYIESSEIVSVTEDTVETGMPRLGQRHLFLRPDNLARRYEM